MRKDTRGVYTALSTFPHRLENTTIQQEAIQAIFDTLKLRFDERTGAVITRGSLNNEGGGKTQKGKQSEYERTAPRLEDHRKLLAEVESWIQSFKRYPTIVYTDCDCVFVASKGYGAVSVLVWQYRIMLGLPWLC